MLGCVMKDMRVRRIAEEGATLGPRPQLFGFEWYVAQGGDVFAEFQAPVCVEVVDDPVEALDVLKMRGHMADVAGEIGAGPGLAEVPDQFAGGCRERGHEDAGTMTNVLELSFFWLAGL